ncbi:glucuronosyltransferase [Sphingomonas sp. HF-S3]|uniref:Glucuronosyltransferase n=1 Tax=Sphingomonas rustica TaxID=3103142 RepID=A0ABV0BB27_9SPHN
MLLRSAFERFDPVFATTNSNLAVRDGLERVHVIPDSNRDQPIRSLKTLAACIGLIWRVRPTLLISTGALPGLFCLIAARLLGARTIWIDSVANSDQPSLSGKCARPFASLWLTQWRHLSDERDIDYWGALL